MTTPATGGSSASSSSSVVLDMEEYQPTRSRTASAVSQCDLSQAEESIDTTTTPKRYMPFFSISRFLRGPHQGSSSSVISDDDEPPVMSEPSSTSDEDDNRSDVPSLSSLEAGENHRRVLMAPTAPEPVVAVPMTIEEKARFFLNSYPSHFEPPSCNSNTHKNDVDGQTDSECGSNSSRSSLTSQDWSVRFPPTHTVLDKQSILFPTVSRFRDQQACTSYMFSVFVGVVVLIVLIVFMLVMNLR